MCSTLLNRRRTMMQQVGGEELPAGYTRLLALRNDKKAFIKTNIYHGGEGGINFDEVKMRFKFLYCGQINGMGGGWFGCHGTGVDNYLGIGSTRSNKLFFTSNLASDDTITMTIGSIYDIDVIYNTTSADLYVGGIFVRSINRMCYPIHSMAIFGLTRYDNSIVMPHYVEIYELQLCKNGEVVYNFIPCLDENGVGGLFESVNRQMYYNTAGSGEFVPIYLET